MLVICVRLMSDQPRGLYAGVNHAQFAENSPRNVVRGDIASQLPDAEATARIAEVPAEYSNLLMHFACLLQTAPLVLECVCLELELPVQPHTCSTHKCITSSTSLSGTQELPAHTQNEANEHAGRRTVPGCAPGPWRRGA